MKDLILCVKHHNWNMIGPGEWTNTEWKIYNDYSVDIKISYNTITDEKKNKNLICSITEDNYKKLLELINIAKENKIKVDANDGSAWELIQYNNGVECWKRDADYIYGIEPLENIAEILNSLTTN